MNNLDEITAVRFFKGDKKKRALFMKQYKGTWDNDSHFIRSACIYFMKNYKRVK